MDGEESSKALVNWQFSCFETNIIATRRDTYWRNLGKRLTYYYMLSDKTQCSKSTTLTASAREIRTICNWFCFKRKCINVRHITKQDVEAFEGYIGTLGLTENTAVVKLGLLRILWVLREELGEGLSFDPYIIVVP